MKAILVLLLCCCSLAIRAQTIDLSKTSTYEFQSGTKELTFVNAVSGFLPKVRFQSSGSGTTSSSLDWKLVNPRKASAFNVQLRTLPDVASFGIADPLDKDNLVVALTPNRSFSVTVVSNTAVTGSQELTRIQARPEIEPTGMPFKDAIMLKQLASDERHTKILAFYGIGDTEKKANPFLKSFYERQDVKNAFESAGVMVSRANGGGAQAALSASAVADALGKFIAKRFKEEMNLAYLNGFKAKLDDLAVKPLQLLLPATHRLLRDTDPYAYTTFLKSLQESGREDLKLAPENTLALLNDDVIWNRVKAKADPAVSIYGSTLTILHTATSVYRGEQVAKAIGTMNELPVLARMTAEGKDTRAAIELAALLARNFQEEDGDFIAFDTFKKNTDENVILLFLGLLYHKEKTTLEAITWTGHPSAYHWLTSLGTAINATQTQATLRDIHQYLDRVVTISQTFKRPADVSTNATNFDTYHRYIKGSLDLLETTLNLSFIAPLVPSSDVKKTYLPLAQASLSLMRAIYEKQYGVALTSALNLGMQMVTDDTIIPADTRQTIIQYGTFVVTLVNADGSDQMVQALEAAALPVASYRIKRSNHFNISLNAYGGAFAGLERFQIDPNLSRTEQTLLMPDKIRNGLAFGATAPVGLAFSWGGFDCRCETKKKVSPGDGASWTVFLPLLDVGSVFAFRLQDQTSVLPELAWKNIIAPGIWFIHGFRNSPLTLTALAQYGPQLRTISLPTSTTANGGTTPTTQVTAQVTINPPSWRFALALAADIPVFNFFTRKGSKKKK